MEEAQEVPWQRRSVAVRAEARRTEAPMMIAMSRNGYVEKFGRIFLIALVGEVCCWYCVCGVGTSVDAVQKQEKTKLRREIMRLEAVVA